PSRLCRDARSAQRSPRNRSGRTASGGFRRCRHPPPAAQNLCHFVPARHELRNEAQRKTPGMSATVPQSSLPQSLQTPPRRPHALTPPTMSPLSPPAPPGRKARAAPAFANLELLGGPVLPAAPQVPDGYFANSLAGRRNEFLEALASGTDTALLAIRGG